jgi:hypothetical protein
LASALRVFALQAFSMPDRTKRSLGAEGHMHVIDMHDAQRRLTAAAA